MQVFANPITITIYIHNHYYLHTSCTVVHLFNGCTMYEGRVEIFYNNEWGTVCDDGWDLNDAQVVCGQLGFGPAIKARGNAYYGEGNGQIWLSNLNCTGTEVTIDDCSHDGWGVQNCSHEKDANVKCANGN